VVRDSLSRFLERRIEMDELQWMTYWQRIYEELFIFDDSPRLLPEPAQLDSAEKEVGLVFPASYRGFLRTFGPGRISQRFTVLSPGYPDAPVVDFLSADGWQSVVSEDRDGDPYPKQLVAFGLFRGYHGWFAWDRECVTDSKEPEYRIVFVPRFSDESIIRMADSFREWIEESVLGLDFYRQCGSKITQESLEWIDEETGERRTHRCFDPIG
jgi:hypothetical protein